MKSTDYDMYEKVLLYNNFIIDKKNTENNIKTLVKNKIKKKLVSSKYVLHYENGYYDIIIEKNYKIYKLDMFDICTVSSDLLKKVEEYIWDDIIKFFKII